jgi:drug/metabolite transporter (DMT)-like permease
VLVHALFTVVQIGTFNLGTSFSRAGRASVLINIHPLVVAPLAAVFLNERMGRKGVLGLLAAVAGVAVLLGRSFLEKQPTSAREIAGDLIVIASGVVFGVQTIVQKLSFPRIAPTTLLFSQSLAAVPMFLGFSLIAEGPASYHFTPAALGGLLYQGLAALGLCYTLWFWLLTHYPAGKLSTIAFLTPLFGIAFGRIFQGEPMTSSLLAAAALVGLGIHLVASDRAGRARTESAPGGGPEPVRPHSARE